MFSRVSVRHSSPIITGCDWPVGGVYILWNIIRRGGHTNHTLRASPTPHTAGRHSSIDLCEAWPNHSSLEVCRYGRIWLADKDTPISLLLQCYNSWSKGSNSINHTRIYARPRHTRPGNNHCSGACIVHTVHMYSSTWISILKCTIEEWTLKIQRDRIQG
jgi:hypothetical protein